MVRYSLIALAVVALFGCEPEEDCDRETCGTLVHKYHTPNLGEPAHNYVIERECDGSRFTVKNSNSIQFNQTYVGDHVCSEDFRH